MGHINKEKYRLQQKCAISTKNHLQSTHRTDIIQNFVNHNKFTHCTRELFRSSRKT